VPSGSRRRAQQPQDFAPAVLLARAPAAATSPAPPRPCPAPFSREASSLAFAASAVWASMPRRAASSCSSHSPRLCSSSRRRSNSISRLALVSSDNSVSTQWCSGDCRASLVVACPTCIDLSLLRVLGGKASNWPEAAVPSESKLRATIVHCASARCRAWSGSLRFRHPCCREHGCGHARGRGSSERG
jgi:hypothetical protein